MNLNLESLAELTTSIDPGVAVASAPHGLHELSVVKWLLREEGFTHISRAVDLRWDYAGLFRESINVGFDPFGDSIMGARISAASEWRKDPTRRDFARLNIGNRLLREVFFQIHDLFHMWAYRWMMNCELEFAFAHAPISESNLEDYVFCHLLSEAAATIGLDYWYLSQRSLGDYFDLPLAFRGLTVSYSQSLDEVLARETAVRVQSPAFFSLVAQLYTTGLLPGVERSTLAKEPALANWLRHELDYSSYQRVYSYQWLSHLGGLKPPSAERCMKEIPATGWRQKLVQELGDALWDMIQREHFTLGPHQAQTAFPKKGGLALNVAYANPCLFTLLEAPTFDAEIYRRHKACTYDYDSFTSQQRREIADCQDLSRFQRLLDAGSALEQRQEPWLIFQLG